MPAFSYEMPVDRKGCLWVKGFDVARPGTTAFPGAPPMYPGETAPWSVFDADGGYLGKPRYSPASRAPEGAADRRSKDFVLGIYTDELGVETVRVYGLERG